MLSEDQLKFTQLFNTHISNVKKLVLNFVDKEKQVIHNEKLQLETTIKTREKIHITYLNLINHNG